MQNCTDPGLDRCERGLCIVKEMGWLICRQLPSFRRIGL